MPGEHTKLSSSTTVARYRALEASNNRIELARFVCERFDERYFNPIEMSRAKHGFASLAVACLVIETLESFYQGREDTKLLSRQMFSDFFKRDTGLKELGTAGDWFFLDIRCGILHQAEARGGWRVLRSGPLVDASARTINATRLLRELRNEVRTYAAMIRTDDAVWTLFKKKMKAVCDNCA
jgi:hypothetical protein